MPNTLFLTMAWLATSAAGASGWGSPAAAPADTAEARYLLGSVDLHGDTIIVNHDRDLWVVTRDGGLATRLLGADQRDQDDHPVGFPRYAPHFSPSGDRLAFSGGGDAYVLDRATGAVRRLTYHPRGDGVRGWSPAGDTVYFSSFRWKSGNNFQLHAIAADGGFPVQLPLPFAFDASVSRDGRLLVYQRFLTPGDWISYDGGMARALEVVDPRTWTVVDSVPEGRFQDVEPAWVGGTIYFRSARAARTADGPGGPGGFDLWRWRPGSGLDPERLTRFRFSGVDAFGTDGERIGFTAEGGLWLLGGDAGALRPVPLRFPAALAPVDTMRVPLAEGARSSSLDAGGSLAVASVRGDLFLRDRRTGEVRRLTRTPEAREHGPALSPDGGTVAYWADASGEERLHLLPLVEPDAAPRVIPVEDEPTRYADLVWSPDGRRLAFSGERLGLWIVEVGPAGTAAPTGAAGAAAGAAAVTRADAPAAPRRIATAEFPGQGDWRATWSPDGRWLAYAKADESGVRGVHLYDPAADRHVRVSDPLTSTTAPVFDPAGDRLYMAATEQAPLAVARDIPAWGLLSTNWHAPLMSARLQVALLSDLDAGPADASRADGSNADEGRRERPRVLPLPVDRRDVVELEALGPGELLVRSVAWPETPGEAGRLPTPVHLWRRAEPSELELLVEDADELRPVPADERFLYRRGDVWHLARVGADTADALDWAGDSVTVDRLAEWVHIHVDAWRRVGTTYVGPERDMLDLEALEAHYAAYLPHLRNRGELNALIRKGFSHLDWVSHLAVFGGAEWPRPGAAEEPDVPVAGLLGADLEPAAEGWRFTRVFRNNRYSALFREVTAPLDAPEATVREGEYLLAVDGTPVPTDRNPYAAFLGTADRPTEITVGPRADGTGARTLTVRPVDDDRLLRETAWAEANRRLVDERSGGRIGYVWLKLYIGDILRQTMGSLAALRDRDGLIVDHRFNGGGTTADALIEALGRRPLYSYDFRHGRDLRIPTVLAPPRRVLIANQHDGSAAETSTLMWKRAGLGPVVGTRTLGGLVGASLNQPPLVDGGRILVPNRASRAPGLPTSELEGVGVAPDRFVDWTVADWRAGVDPQLEAALELLLEEVLGKETGGR